MFTVFKKTAHPLFLVFFIVTLFLFGAIAGERYVAHASLFDFFQSKFTINPLVVEIFLPSKIEVSRVFKIDANIINNGKEKINVVEVEIFLPPELSLLGANSIKNVGIIPSEKKKNISWAVNGNFIGSYIVSVSIRVESNRDIVSAVGRAEIEVIEQTSSPVQSVNIFLRFFAYIGEWLFSAGIGS